jgi:hypothetical protein
MNWTKHAAVISCVALLCGSAFTIHAKTRKVEKSPAPAVSAPTAPVDVTDPQVISVVNDMNRISAEIGKQIQETGTIHRAVSTQDLQQLFNLKQAWLSQWYAKNHIPGTWQIKVTGPKTAVVSPPPAAKK